MSLSLLIGATRQVWPDQDVASSRPRCGVQVVHVHMPGLLSILGARRAAGVGAQVVADIDGETIVGASGEARRQGIRTGMSLQRARDRHAGVEVVRPGARDIDAALGTIEEMLVRYAPELDVRGCDALTITLWTPAANASRRVALRIRHEIEQRWGVGPRIGVGPTDVIARAAAEMGRPGDIHRLDRPAYRQRVSTSPVTSLRALPGRVTRHLADLDIVTVGDLASADTERVRGRLGIIGLELIRLARGDSTTSATTRAPATVVRRTATSRLPVDPVELRPASVAGGR